MGEAFQFKTPSSILIVGPSGCGKTCFTESLLLDHLEELFVNPPLRFIIATGRGKTDLETWKKLVCNFMKGFQSHHLKSWFPKGGLLVLDDLMAEGGEDKRC